jgi:hypothetical protein
MAIKMRILGATAVGFALCGCASTAGNVASKPAAAQNDRNCVVDTGSRLAPAPGTRGCRGIGRSYSDEDISRTGRIDVGDALSQLDPSVTVHH